MTDHAVEPVPEEEENEALHQMQPLRRNPLAQDSGAAAVPEREPINVILQRVLRESLDEPEREENYSVAAAALEDADRLGYREVDPIFVYLFLISLAIGLSTFDPLVRYLLLWVLMGSAGLMGYMSGAASRLQNARFSDLIRGAALGVLSVLPFVLVFGPLLETTSVRMFDVPDTPPRVMNSWVFMAVGFVAPAVETLFFRGAVQEVRGIFFTTVLATLWAVVMFFPYMSLGNREIIAGILIMVFALLNFMYSYVRHRNGLAGAWLCQITSATLLWFAPRLLF